MKNKIKTAFAILLPLILLAAICWRRQSAVNRATREWEEAGGGIVDSEIPLLGPSEIFVDLNEHLSQERVDALNAAARSIFHTSSPCIQLRWKNQDGYLAIADDDHLAVCTEVFRDSEVKCIWIMKADLSVNAVVNFLHEVKSINRLIVPNNCLTQSELKEANRRLGRELIQHRGGSQ